MKRRTTMDSTRFDSLTRALSGGNEGRSRRTFLTLASGGLLAGLAPALAAEATKRKKRKKRKKHKRGGGGDGELSLRAICDPAATTPAETCQSGLRCDTPTTRHTCSGTVEGVDTWCCVPPGGKCTECDCCGDYYCDFGDANPDGACIPNPEG
jgi:hypothetical protein